MSKTSRYFKIVSPFQRFARRFLAVLLIAGVLTGILLLAVDAYVSAVGRQTILKLDELSSQSKYDCVIVPGALVYDSGRPSAMLRDRLDMAVRIYRSGVTDRILVSGDHGRTDYNEVGVMRQYLLDAGIPAEHVFMDHAGFDTYDSLYRAQSIFGVRRAVITTQDFHLIRALYIGKQLNLELQGVDCGYVFSSEKSRYRLREYPARFKAFLDCEIFMSQPTFTGETIPITGTGWATVD
ncbi:MAG TPA: hypothetical protein DCM45_01755 [Clostridiales bacterium]|nr:hypothetical protein [Clostridiales bacterium]